MYVPLCTRAGKKSLGEKYLSRFEQSRKENIILSKDVLFEATWIPSGISSKLFNKNV